MRKRYDVLPTFSRDVMQMIHAHSSGERNSQATATNRYVSTHRARRVIHPGEIQHNNQIQRDETLSITIVSRQ